MLDWRSGLHRHPVALVDAHGLAVERLRRALLAGTRITLVFGTDEWGLRALERRDPAGWEAIRRHPRLATVVLAELDHSMFDPAGRAAVSSDRE